MPENKKVAHSNAFYKARMKRLKKLHNFSFDARQKLTPQRKAAITKQWNQHGDIIKKIEDGVYSFVPATRSQTKKLSEQFPHTNKGIIYNKKSDVGTIRKTRLVGKGKNVQLLDDIKILNARDKKHARKLTLYLPFPSSLDQANIDDYVMSVWQELNPDYVSVAINGYAGTKMVTAKSFAKYHPLLADKIEAKGAEVKEVFTGVYIIYYRAAYSTSWLEKIKQKIQNFQSN